MECKKIIVTTTISPPTEATHKYLQMKGWDMIVVGDLKTPHEEYSKLEREYPQLHYLHPEEQESRYKELSDAIGWNKIMRRNIGFCEAFVQGAQIIATVDDDNIPYDEWGREVYVGREIVIDCWKADNGVFDPLSVTTASYMWHRGYPSELIPTRNNIKYMGRVKRKIHVQADLWDGVPDVDAMNRIIYNPRIKLHVDVPFCSTDISPFNSQNTFLSREVLPYYMVLPHAGRMDDIWGGYLLQKRFPNSVMYGKPTVYQERYEPHHRNMKDLRDETMGYENTLKFIKGEYALPADSQNAYDIYRRFFDNYVKAGISESKIKINPRSVLNRRRKVTEEIHTSLDPVLIEESSHVCGDNVRLMPIQDNSYSGK
jgi:hypothetical protein